ncbi:N-terminal kinase-like protein [Aphis gossypii]|uniref:N-terminal kinase-like protein n=1 Tax=Aphis gossypii TaxID=80765 RepID=UPI00100F61F5|nr:N-terminal kinase-like protein [Aphis gossypii]
MSRFVVFVSMALTSVALAAAQQNAAILTDARYLSNNGQFGAAYTQGDGVQFKEEADAEGNRRGSYSYVDPNGQRRTVSYTAGKDGFKATGDHLPVAPTPVPVPAAHAVPAPAPKSAPWQDQWSQPPAVPNQWNQWNSAPTPKYDDGQWNQWASDDGSKSDDGQWNQWSSEGASSKSDDGQWNQWSSESSNDGQWNQWNSAPSTVAPRHSQWNQWNSIPTTAKWNQWNSAPTPPPTSYNVNHASGKFNLNRSPDGFSYTFSQN